MADNTSRDTTESIRSTPATNEPARRNETSGTISRRREYDPWPQQQWGGGLLSPFSMMRRMFDEIDRMWGQPALSSGGGVMTGWTPAIEVYERDGNFVVCAELPGLSKDDVRVEATDDALIIEGERRHEHSGEEGGYRSTERSYGRFFRSVPLPEGVNAENARAKFNDGVLEVTMPLPERRSNRRKIPLESGTSTSSSGSTSAGQMPSTTGSMGTSSSGGGGTSSQSTGSQRK